jgi:hypothetical protein
MYRQSYPLYSDKRRYDMVKYIDYKVLKYTILLIFLLFEYSKLFKAQSV